MEAKQEVRLGGNLKLEAWKGIRFGLLVDWYYRCNSFMQQAGPPLPTRRGPTRPGRTLAPGTCHIISRMVSCCWKTLRVCSFVHRNWRRRCPRRIRSRATDHYSQAVLLVLNQDNQPKSVVKDQNLDQDERWQYNMMTACQLEAGECSHKSWRVTDSNMNMAWEVALWDLD